VHIPARNTRAETARERYEQIAARKRRRKEGERRIRRHACLTREHSRSELDDHFLFTQQLFEKSCYNFILRVILKSRFLFVHAANKVLHRRISAASFPLTKRKKRFLEPFGSSPFYICQTKRGIVRVIRSFKYGHCAEQFRFTVFINMRDAFTNYSEVFSRTKVESECSTCTCGVLYQISSIP